MTAPHDPPRDGEGSAVLLAVLVDELVRGGVRDVVTSPGSRNTPLLRATVGCPGLRATSVVDERTAAFVALGLARATAGPPRPVLVTCTSGSAVAHHLPAVVEAHHARIPLILLTADRPAELLDVGAGQTIAQAGIHGDRVRWQGALAVDRAGVGEVRFVRGLAARMLAAAHGAWGAGAGPVHLNVPLREPLAPADPPDPPAGRDGDRPWVRRTGASGRPDADAVRHVAELLTGAPRAVFVAGRHEADPAMGPAVAALGELAAIPVVADPLSGARRGGAALSAYDAALRADPDGAPIPDLVVRVGDLPTSKALRRWLAALPSSTIQVHVTADGAWQDPDGVLTDVVHASPRALLEELAPRLATRSADRGWLASWTARDAAARDAMTTVLDADDAPVTEPWLAREITALMPPASTLLVAASMPIRDVEAQMAPRSGLRVLANRGANGIDGTIATAWGLAAGRDADDGPVVVLTGDVALLHDVGSLVAAGRAGVDLTVVVVDNDGGGIFHFLPVADDPSSAVRDHVLTPTGLDLPAVASAAGASLVDVPDRSALLPALRAAVVEPGVSLLVVRTDRVANRALHRTLDDVVGDRLRTG
ncbi:MAG: 2-succinyl-5-enolpyruvyl-6-hydroxy-3-cyclohexene-1-carboxylic-acid synthase [Solirubrobacteraceae bacterium]|nr:2-succinyl-5-enolpyruvyl-6-hydroxy-3-cyclohexene-1-carboxylic-acid synthase [Solirubrobacteraceae bacterium]